MAKGLGAMLLRFRSSGMFLRSWVLLGALLTACDMGQAPSNTTRAATPAPATTAASPSPVVTGFARPPAVTATPSASSGQAVVSPAPATAGEKIMRFNYGGSSGGEPSSTDPQKTTEAEWAMLTFEGLMAFD